MYRLQEDRKRQLAVDKKRRIERYYIGRQREMDNSLFAVWQEVAY
jgi:hypothetical protein